jgi:hypothetical protein
MLRVSHAPATDRSCRLPPGRGQRLGCPRSLEMIGARELRGHPLPIPLRARPAGRAEIGGRHAARSRGSGSAIMTPSSLAGSSTHRLYGIGQVLGSSERRTRGADARPGWRDIAGLRDLDRFDAWLYRPSSGPAREGVATPFGRWLRLPGDLQPRSGSSPRWSSATAANGWRLAPTTARLVLHHRSAWASPKSPKSDIPVTMIPTLPRPEDHPLGDDADRSRSHEGNGMTQRGLRSPRLTDDLPRSCVAPPARPRIDVTSRRPRPTWLARWAATFAHDHPAGCSGCENRSMDGRACGRDSRHRGDRRRRHCNLGHAPNPGCCRGRRDSLRRHPTPAPSDGDAGAHIRQRQRRPRPWTPAPTSTPRGSGSGSITPSPPTAGSAGSGQTS